MTPAKKERSCYAAFNLFKKFYFVNHVWLVNFFSYNVDILCL